MDYNDQIIIEEFYKLIGIEYEMPHIVYHYTSVDSLLKIIENNSLWLSNRKHMNDMMDSEYIEQTFRNKFSNKFNQTNFVSPIAPQYVFSTTLLDDSFFHYSCYGNYCIGFNTMELIKYFVNCIKSFSTHEGIANLFTYSKVIYDESIIDKISTVITEEYPKNMENELNTPFSSFIETGKWTIIYKHFFAIIKQKGFASEHEFRFLFETVSKYKFRSNNNKRRIISYLDMKLSDTQLLPIESIKIGPFADQTDYESLKNFLYQMKYGNTKLSSSTLKIRV